MAEILKGAPVAAALSEKIRSDVEALKAKGIIPTLALVRVGEKPEDLAYERGAVKRAEKVGVEIRKEVFPGDITEEAFLKELDRVNNDSGIHGILLFQPLPKHINNTAACEMIDPDKDIDGCMYDMADLSAIHLYLIGEQLLFHIGIHVLIPDLIRHESSACSPADLCGIR